MGFVIGNRYGSVIGNEFEERNYSDDTYSKNIPRKILDSGQKQHLFEPSRSTD